MTNIDKARSIIGVSAGRDHRDFYPTPANAIIPLMDREIFGTPIWEPACGNGAISKYLINERGMTVVSTDLYDWGYGEAGINFLSTTPIDNYPKTIITNPPFNIINEWIEHSIFDLNIEKMALFGKLALLEGEKRSRILERTPLKWVYVFRKRVLLTRMGEEPRGSGMIAFAWYVWERDYKGKPAVSWL